MKVYKGTDKNMQCRGMQYKLGQKETAEDAIRCGNKGLHSCEAPMDVWRYYPPVNGNRYFEGEADGKIDRTGADDSKLASTELTINAEIGILGIVKAQIAYTRSKAQTGTTGGGGSNLAGGDESNLAGGDWSNLAGGDWSNLAGGYRSNLAGGNRSNLAGGTGSNLAGGNESNLAGGAGSNLAGGDRSNLAGGDESNLAGGDESNLAGGDRSNLAGGNESNLAGGAGSNLAGGDWSNLAGGDNSLIVGGDCSIARGGIGSVIVLVNRDDNGNIVDWAAAPVDGKRIKADTYYKLHDGALVPVEEE